MLIIKETKGRPSLVTVNSCQCDDDVLKHRTFCVFGIKKFFKNISKINCLELNIEKKISSYVLNIK